MKNLGKIKEQFSAFKALNEEYVKMSVAIQKDADNLLRSLIDANGGEISGDLLEGVYVAYDGGNHPEYASTLASDVNRIYIDGGKVYFDLEDEQMYSLDRVIINDLVWVAYDVIRNLNGFDNE